MVSFYMDLLRYFKVGLNAIIQINTEIINISELRDQVIETPSKARVWFEGPCLEKQLRT